MKEKEIKETVLLAQIAGASPESKEFWDEYRERVRIREESTKKLVEARKTKHL